MNHSPYQVAIFNAIKEAGPRFALIIEAVAGSGKTTTIVKALELTSGSVLFGAFNKHIATELQARVPSHVTASTLNSIGWQICKQAFPKARLDADKTSKILKNVLEHSGHSPAQVRSFFQIKNQVSRIVGLAKALCLRKPSYDEVTKLMDAHDLTLNGAWSLSDFVAFVQKVYFHCIDETSVLDFDDQIFMPWLYELPARKYDWFFGDEAQDFTFAQIALVVKLSDRIVCVGDSRQAIYGFRGAALTAMADLKDALGAFELPLSICYRCPQSVVQTAKVLVPHIECAESAPEGIVDHVKANKVDLAPRDYVLCRVTAPLVTAALAEIRKGKKATVLGRDIGKALLAHVTAVPDCQIKDFYSGLDTYFEDKRAKLVAQNASEARLNNLEDGIETIRALMGSCSLEESAHNALTALVSKIFGDDPEADAIIFSSIHKSKGLEADHVYISRPDLLPHPSAKSEWQKQQEANLHYVAITRAKKHLTYITE